MASSTGRTPLGRSFGRLWGAAASSNLADGILLLAAPLLAVQLTRSPTLVAGVTVAFTLPQIVVALPVGVLADRMRRRRVIVAANLVRLVAAGGLALAAGASGLSLVVLYLGVLALGAAEVAADTTTHAAIPEVVARDRLAAANSRMQGTQRLLNDFVGAPLAGPLVAAGAVWVLGLPAVLFAVAAALATTVPGPVPEPTGTTVRSDLVEGLAHLWRDRLLRDLCVGAAVINAASASFSAVFVLYAVAPGPMGLPETAFGLLIAGNAVGALVGAVVAERVDRHLGLARLVRVGLVVIAVAFAVPVATSAVAPVALAFAVTGTAAMCLNVGVGSLRQLLVPRALLGRVTSAVRMVAMGAMPLGALLGGVIGEVFGLRVVFAIAAAGVVVAMLVLRRVTPEVVADAHRRCDEGAL